MLDLCGNNDKGADLFYQIEKAVPRLQLCDKSGEVKTVTGDGWQMTETPGMDAKIVTFRKTVTLDGKAYQLETESTQYDDQYNNKDKSVTVRGDTHVNRLWQGLQLVVANTMSHCTSYMNFQVGNRELGLIESNESDSVILFERAVQIALNLPQKPFYRPYPFGYNIL